MIRRREDEADAAANLLLADNFYQGAFSTAAVEFAVEDLFPRAEVEFAFGDGDNDFAAHDLTLEMRIGVIFASAVVAVSRGGRVRRQFLQPNVVVMMQARLVVVDEEGVKLYESHAPLRSVKLRGSHAPLRS